MIYVILISVWLFAYMTVAPEQSYYRRKIYTVVAGLLLFLVMGLRHPSVGVDTAHYISCYFMPDISFDNIFLYTEYGFTLFNFLLQNIWRNGQVFILVYSLFICVAFSWFFFKYSRNLFLSFFLHLTIGLFSMTFSGIRQSIAIAICLFAFKMMIEKKFFKFICLVFIATTFHFSAIIFLPVYFLNFLKKLNIRIVIGFLIGIFVVLVFRRQFVPVMELLVPEQYSEYSLLSKSYPINPLLVASYIAIPVVSFIVYWINGKKDTFTEKLLILSITCCYLSIFSFNSNLIGRLAFYYLPINMLLIPNVISGIKDSKTKMIALILCILFPAFQFFKALPEGRLQLDKYSFFWEDKW